MENILELSFVGLMSVGFVNVVTFFFPNLDSRVKFTLSFLFAFGLTFVPKEIGSVVLDHAREALAAAFALSGAYKMLVSKDGATN